MSAIQSLLRVMTLRDAEAIILEAGKVPQPVILVDSVNERLSIVRRHIPRRCSARPSP